VSTSPPPPPGPPPAPLCTKGPSAAQVLAVIKDNPAIPENTTLAVQTGPYCAGSWHYTTVGEAGVPDVEPLAVVTSGKPASLKLVELGQDVCSDNVQRKAPVGIRVWACGS
jgi:hypothetical protein